MSTDVFAKAQTLEGAQPGVAVLLLQEENRKTRESQRAATYIFEFKNISIHYLCLKNVFYLCFFKLWGKVYLENYRGSRSEPAGLRRLRNQVTEATEGPSELGRETGEGKAPAGKNRGKGKAHTCSREGA